jgi:hypothetical protein
MRGSRTEGKSTAVDTRPVTRNPLRTLTGEKPREIQRSARIPPLTEETAINM